MAKKVVKKEVMDMTTGEILQMVCFVPEVKDKNFVKVFKACSEKVVKDLRNDSEVLLLLFWIMNNLHPNDDKVYINAKLVAKELGKSKSTIHRYINILVAKGYLFKIPEVDCWYRINTDYLVKGYAKKVKDWFEEEEE